MELDIAMRKTVIAAAITLLPSLAWGQCTGVFPPNTLCGNLSGVAAPPRAFSSGGSVTGPGSTIVNDITTWNNTSGTLLKDSGVNIGANTANTVFAGPATGVPAAAAFRGLVSADLPSPYSTLSAGTSGGVPYFSATNALSSSGVLATNGVVVGGGAGAAPSTVTAGASNQFLTGNTGAAPGFRGIASADLTTPLTTPPPIGGTTPAAGTFTSFKTTGDAFFGSGRPWVDVRSGTNSCAAALGNGVTDDTAAIQCQITFMNSTYGGGTVYFPCGSYKISSGGGAPITVSTGVVLVGEGSRKCSSISTGNVDTAALIFTGAGNNFSGLRDIWIICDTTGGALTNNCVTVNASVNVDFDRCAIWGGNFAINMLGTDSRIRNCFIMGVGSSGGAIASTGANFYTDDKFDSIGPTVQFIFFQGTSATIQENHFIDCDFSAAVSSNAITIADGNNLAITTIQGSITSASINITGAKYTMFSAMEFGSAVSSSAPMSVVGSYGLSALTFTGAGTRSCAGNSNITC